MASAGSGLTSSGLTGYAVPNGQFMASCASNALTVSIKNADGTDPSPTKPLFMAFRNDPASGGLLEGRTLTAPISLTVPNGSIFAVNAATVGFRIWVVLFDDGGVYRLAIILPSFIDSWVNGNQVSTTSLVEYGLASSSLVTSSMNAWVFYTSGSTVSAKPFRIIGFVDFNSGLAGTSWNVQPDFVQMFGPGLALPGTSVFSFMNSTYLSGLTINAAIPFDGTYPQVTEGTQAASSVITPSSKLNIIHAVARIPFSLSAANHLTGAWFFGSETDSSGSNSVYAPAADAMTTLVVDMKKQAKTLSSISLYLRIGTPTAVPTIKVGATSTIALFAGQIPVVTEISELMV